ncbi:MAG: outer membrane beta-barrel protein [Bacteroidales bacterium]|nr:outer membrane beta-barrel protein [Bacteroidales bacterium]
MIKKILTVLLFAYISTASIFAQKFTKREQARREAREKNYFCGNMFTITVGYNHSWLSSAMINLASTYYGKSEKLANTNNAFNVGVLWDYAFKNTTKWSSQVGAYYSMKGGQHLYYYDNKLGQGPQLREEETQNIYLKCIEVQALARYSFPLAYDQRITINAGPYITKFINTPDEFHDWDFGIMVGVGFDYKHISASLSYQPGIYSKVSRDSNTRVSNLSLNIGYRFWK